MESGPSIRRTRLVATLGPSTDEDDVLTAMFRAGLDVARINTAHSDADDVRRRVAQVKRCAATFGGNQHVAILLDLQGPKIRVGNLPTPIRLLAGTAVTLMAEGHPSGPEGTIPISYEPLAREVSRGAKILLNDGLIRLEVLETDGIGTVRGMVVAGGLLSAHKGVNLPDSELSASSPTEADLDDARLGMEVGVDFLGLSFVRRANDVRRLRAAVGSGVGIVAKIERPGALNHLPEIVAAADAVMVARGDLGVEMPLEQVPTAELAILQEAHRQGTPAIVATEMLESMQTQERPTRAEVTDVFYAVGNLADAVMLSAESAVGRHPVLAVQMLARLTAAADAVRSTHAPQPSAGDITGWVAYSAVALAESLGARAIVSPTTTGTSARQVARFHPPMPIIAVVASDYVARQLSFTWGVTPVVAEANTSTDRLIETSVRAVRAAGHVDDGELVILTAGIPIGRAGTMNLLKVHRLGDTYL